MPDWPLRATRDATWWRVSVSRLAIVPLCRVSEVPPMQGAHARLDGVLFQPLSAGIPPWAQHNSIALKLSQLLNKHLLRDGRNGSLQLRETHDSAKEFSQFCNFLDIITS